MLTERVRMSFIFGHFPWAKWHMRKEKEGWHVHVNNYVTFDRDLAKRNCRLVTHKIILLQLLYFMKVYTGKNDSLCLVCLKILLSFALSM